MNKFLLLVFFLACYSFTNQFGGVNCDKSDDALVKKEKSIEELERELASLRLRVAKLESVINKKNSLDNGDGSDSGRNDRRPEDTNNWHNSWNKSIPQPFTERLRTNGNIVYKLKKKNIFILDILEIVHQKCQEDYSRAMIEMHNKYRSRHGVPPLKDTNKLQRSAFKHAIRNAQSGRMDSNSGVANTGINLAFMGGSVVNDCYKIGTNNFEMWYRGEKLYNYEKGGFSIKTGLFTQVVWKSSRQLGCGVSIKNNQAYGVCHYFPAGNVQTQFQQNVLPPRSNG